MYALRPGWLLQRPDRGVVATEAAEEGGTPRPPSLQSKVARLCFNTDVAQVSSLPFHDFR